MGWSISPNTGLASIDNNGKVTFLEHTEPQTYRVTYSDSDCSDWQNITVRACPVTCKCEDVDLNAVATSEGLSIPAEGYTSNTIIGTYDNTTCLTSITASSDKTWITITSVSNGNVYATVEENTSTENTRDATITVTGKDGNDEDCSDDFRVLQEKSAFTCSCTVFTVSPRSGCVPASAGTTNIGTYDDGSCVTNIGASNVPGWVSNVNFSYGTISAYIAANSGPAQRTGTLTITGTADSDTCTKSLELCQDGTACNVGITWTISDTTVGCDKFYGIVPTTFKKQRYAIENGKCVLKEDISLKKSIYTDYCTSDDNPYPRNSGFTPIEYTFNVYYQASDDHYYTNAGCSSVSREQLFNADGTPVTVHVTQRAKDDICCTYVYGTDNNQCNEPFVLSCSPCTINPSTGRLVCEATSDAYCGPNLAKYDKDWGVYGRSYNNHSQNVTSVTVDSMSSSNWKDYLIFYDGPGMYSLKRLDNSYGFLAKKNNTTNEDIIVVVEHWFTDTTGLPDTVTLDGETYNFNKTDHWYSTCLYRHCSTECTGGNTMAITNCVPSVASSNLGIIGSYSKSPDGCISEWSVDTNRQVSGTSFIDTSSIVFTNGSIYGKVNSTNETTSTRTCQIPTIINGREDYFTVVQCAGGTPTTYSYTVNSDVNGATVQFWKPDMTQLYDTKTIQNGTCTSNALSYNSVTAKIFKDGCTFPVSETAMTNGGSATLNGTCGTPPTTYTYTVTADAGGEGAIVNYWATIGGSTSIVHNGTISNGSCVFSTSTNYGEISIVIMKEGCTFSSATGGKVNPNGSVAFTSSCSSPDPCTLSVNISDAFFPGTGGCQVIGTFTTGGSCAGQTPTATYNGYLADFVTAWTFNTTTGQIAACAEYNPSETYSRGGGYTISVGTATQDIALYQAVYKCNCQADTTVTASISQTTFGPDGGRGNLGTFSTSCPKGCDWNLLSYDGGESWFTIEYQPIGRPELGGRIYINMQALPSGMNSRTGTVELTYNNEWIGGTITITQTRS